MAFVWLCLGLVGTACSGSGGSQAVDSGATGADADADVDADADTDVDADADADTDSDTQTGVADDCAVVPPEITLADFDAGLDAGGGECCQRPVDIALCWWRDAQRDGVTCGRPGDCECPGGNECILAEGNPGGLGLCACRWSVECRRGVCTKNGVCGPSYCNDAMTCSCWGGCVSLPPMERDTDSLEQCSEAQPGVIDGNCREGEYPKSPFGVNCSGTY